MRVESSTELFFLLFMLGSWIVYGVYNFTFFLWDMGSYLMVGYGIYSGCNCFKQLEFAMSRPWWYGMVSSSKYTGKDTEYTTGRQCV